jgi:hypothetical protein
MSRELHAVIAVVGALLSVLGHRRPTTLLLASAPAIAFVVLSAVVVVSQLRE